MDSDKMKQWLELAKQFHQGQFWDGIFEADYAKQLVRQFTGPSSEQGLPEQAFPRAEVLRGSREIVILIDLPGIRKEDVELSLMDGSLHIRGMARQTHADLQVVRTERYKGEFERAIPLPESVAPGTRISAKFDQGLLEIRLPRTPRPRESIRID